MLRPIHLKAKPVSRAHGRSVTAAAAYRAACEIECERYGETHDYTRKQGVIHSEIMAPDNAPEWMKDRAALWNAVEKIETRKNARLAREIELALPHELTDEQRRDMLRRFVAEQFVARGMIADFSIHRPHRDGDQRNHHAHVLLTCREILGDGFHPKKSTDKARDWNRDENLLEWRKAWAAIQNREFERLGLEIRVTEKSFEELGIDREPEQHLGPAASSMERRGQKTRIGAENNRRRAANDNRARLHLQALNAIVRVEEEKARYAAWESSRRAALKERQTATLRELQEDHAVRARALESDLAAFYGPHLTTAQAEADRLQKSLEGGGIRSLLRRFWRGRQDREQLEAIRASIADAQFRMKEARGKLEKAYAADAERLAALQETRRREQEEGLTRTREQKEKTLTAQLARAKEEAERTARPETDIAAELQETRTYRQAIHEQRQIRALQKAADREAQKHAVRATTPARKAANRLRSLDAAERAAKRDHQWQAYEAARAEKQKRADQSRAAELERLRPSFERRQAELDRQRSHLKAPEEGAERDQERKEQALASRMAEATRKEQEALSGPEMTPERQTEPPSLAERYRAAKEAQKASREQDNSQQPAPERKGPINER